MKSFKCKKCGSIDGFWCGMIAEVDAYFDNLVVEAHENSVDIDCCDISKMEYEILESEPENFIREIYEPKCCDCSEPLTITNDTNKEVVCDSLDDIKDYIQLYGENIDDENV